MRLHVDSISTMVRVVLPVFLLLQPRAGQAQVRTGFQLEHEFTIGTALGPAEYVFGRLQDVASSPDGTIHALDAMDQTIKSYSEAGEFLRSFGGEGGGPGEFARAISLQGVPKGLRVFDLFGKRIVIFDLEGNYRGAERVPAFDHFATLESLGENRYVGRTAGVVNYGTLSDSVPIAVVTFGEVGAVDTLLTGQGGVGIWYEKGKERFGNWLPTDFGRSVSIAVDRDRNRVFLVDGIGGTVLVYRIEHDGQMRLERRLATGLSGVPVTSADLAEALRRMLAQRALESPQLVSPRTPMAKGPAEWSGIRAVIVEDSGHVWLEEWGRRPDPTVPIVWRRYDPRLETYSTVRVPGNIRVTDVRNGRFYAITQAELGYDQIAVFRLVPTPEVSR